MMNRDTTSSRHSKRPAEQSTPTSGGPTFNGADRGMADPSTESMNETPCPPADLDFRNLVQQANDGDKGAFTRLKSVLDENPKIWQRVGDLASVRCGR